MASADLQLKTDIKFLLQQNWFKKQWINLKKKFSNQVQVLYEYG